MCLGARSVVEGARGKAGTSLFKDFQILSRIWNHPWCLQLSYISKENKVNKNDYFLICRRILRHVSQTVINIMLFVFRAILMGSTRRNLRGVSA